MGDLEIRTAVPDDVAAIVAMLADDPLGAQRESATAESRPHQGPAASASGHPLSAPLEAAMHTRSPAKSSGFPGYQPPKTRARIVEVS